MKYTEQPEYKLYEALRQGQIETTKLLIEQGCDIHKVTENEKWTYLHKMMMPLPLDTVTPTESIQFLIDQGLDVNAIDSGGYTPLLFAVRQRNVEGIRLLLENGADKLIEHENERGVSALRMGFDRVPLDYDVFKVLLELGADPDAKNKNGKTVRELLGILANIDPKIHELFEQY